MECFVSDVSVLCFLFAVFFCFGCSVSEMCVLYLDDLSCILDAFWMLCSVFQDALSMLKMFKMVLYLG